MRNFCSGSFRPARAPAQSPSVLAPPRQRREGSAGRTWTAVTHQAAALACDSGRLDISRTVLHPQSAAVQARLDVGQPEQDEQQAERIADRVMRMPASGRSIDCGAGTSAASEAQQIGGAFTPYLNSQTKTEAESSSPLEAALGHGRGRGAPLPDEARAFFEPRFGYDFEHVRIHADSEAAAAARQLGAQAFTHGADLYFGTARYQPHSAGGRRLLAHELAHVVQQGEASSGRSAIQRFPDASTTYRVQSGDSLQGLAAKFGVSVTELVAANSDKVRTWKTSTGKEIKGFDANELIVIPKPAESGERTAPKEESAAREMLQKVGGELARVIGDVWNWLVGPEEAPAKGPQEGAEQPPTGAAKDPIQVIELHNKLGTFGAEGVRVTSTTRDPQKQLDILRGYCLQNRAALDAYAARTDWLKGELRWDALESCTLSDSDTWLPFFFALYYGGGGPGTSSEDRTLPLVASPMQKTWKGRDANASPHLAGKAMDVKDGNLEVLAGKIKTAIPEFNKQSGKFPVNSTQMETAQGQKLVHINFVHPVFPVSPVTKPEDKGTI